jgi:hypothetical protein
MSPEDFPILANVIQNIVERFAPEQRSDICEEYRWKSTIKEIAQKRVKKDDDFEIIKSAVRFILIEDLWEEEYNNLAQKKRRKWTMRQIEEGVGIHWQTPKEKKIYGAVWARAIGREPYSEAEIGEILQLSKLPENIKWTQRFHADKIATALWLVFPNGPQRTSKGISNLLNRLKQEGKI